MANVLYTGTDRSLPRKKSSPIPCVPTDGRERFFTSAKLGDLILTSSTHQQASTFFFFKVTAGAGTALYPIPLDVTGMVERRKLHYTEILVLTLDPNGRENITRATRSTIGGGGGGVINLSPFCKETARK